jgi:opacity protein-like surface antigen
MNRSTALCLPLATLFISAAAQAAEPGFYFGATASRVEHDVDGYPGIPLATATLPPVLGITPDPPISLVPINPDPPFVAFARSIEIDEVDAGFSATAGYRFNRYLAAELTYTDFGEYERIDRLSGFPDVRYELGVSGPSVSVLGSLPLGERWELFLRGGVLFSEQEVSTKLTNGIEKEYSDKVVIAGAGVQWSFTPRWATRLEYQRTDDMKYDDTGESSIEQASLSVLFKL